MCESVKCESIVLTFLMSFRVIHDFNKKIS